MSVRNAFRSQPRLQRGENPRLSFSAHCVPVATLSCNTCGIDAIIRS